MKADQMLSKLEPLLGNKVGRLRASWFLADREERSEIEQALKVLYLKHFSSDLTEKQLLLSPPNQRLCRGEIPLGMTLYNGRELAEFGLRENELCQHVAVFGRSGSGKTNTVRQLLKGFLKQKLPFLVFDWKRDYSRLDFDKTFAGVDHPEIDVLSMGNSHSDVLKFNPLIPPPDTAPEVWVKQLCELLTHAYIGGAGFESVFLEAIDYCYRQKGIYEGGDNYPTFRDIKAYLDTKKCTGRQAQWMQSVTRTINSLCFGGMDATLNSEEPHELPDLLEKNVILELDALANADKVFLTEAFLLFLHHYRLQQPPKRKLDNVIVLEEAHHLLRKGEGEETLVETSLREMRSLGIGIVLIDQMPSLISKVALANTYCTIALNTKTAPDINALSQALLLDAEQKGYLGMLPVGTAIVKLQDRHVQPFAVKIPFVEPAFRASTECRNTNRITVIPANFSEIPANGARNEGIPDQINRKENPEDAFLVDIAEHPTDAVTTRYKRLGLCSRQGNQMKESLVKTALIKPKTISILKGWIRLFDVTSKGMNRLEEIGHAKLSRREGSAEHRYWQTKIAEHLRSKGFKVELEKTVDGHPVDIVGVRKGERVAIEVETGKSNYRQNIRKCLEHTSFTHVVVACVDQVVRQRIRKETEHLDDRRLVVTEVKEVLKSSERGLGTE